MIAMPATKFWTNTNLSSSLITSGSVKQLKKQIEFKRHYFEEIHTLTHQQQKSLWTSFIRKDIIIFELMSEAKETKSFNTLKAMFLR